MSPLFLLFIGIGIGIVIGSPSFIHLAAAANQCFANLAELKTAVGQYVDQDCENNEDDCTVKNTYGYPINSWCVGSVTNMYQLFRFQSEFNSDISSWDVSNVINMASMSEGAMAFESDLSGKYLQLNVSNVKSGEYMNCK